MEPTSVGTGGGPVQLATVDRRWVTVDGVNLHYRESGRGAPIVLLHGMPTSSFLWRQVQERLSDEHRAIAVDLLGFGESDQSEQRDMGIAAQAALVAALIAKLQLGPVTVVGHDFGGAVAQVLAVRFPAAVSRLVLVSSMTARSWPPRLLERFVPAESARRTTVEDLLRHLADELPAQAARRDSIGPDALDSYLAPWSTPGGMGAFFKLARTSDGKLLNSLETELSGLWIPALVVWGADDRVVSIDEGTRLAAMLPSGSLEVLPGVGHLPPEESPEAVSDKIRYFLRRMAKYH